MENNTYHYIAGANPSFARAVISKFGYNPHNVRNKSDLGVALRHLVKNEGEPALREIMTYHPDKDVILELFGNKKDYHNADGDDDGYSRGSSKPSGGCGGCKGCGKFKNADGDAAQASSTAATNSHILGSTTLVSAALIGAALLFGVAIITNNRHH